MSSLINMLISLIPLAAVAIFRVCCRIKRIFFLPFPLLCLALFCLGLGMLLASAMVFFRDIQFLWGVLTTIWMYLTPIFYPITALPETIQSVVKMNPLYFLCNFSALVRHRRSLTRANYVRTVRSGCTYHARHWRIHVQKSQDNFVLYL